MKTTNVYPTIWATPYYTPSVMAGWYERSTQVAELILKNDVVNDLKVSEMNLNITRFSAIDEQGKEIERKITFLTRAGLLRLSSSHTANIFC